MEKMDFQSPIASNFVFERETNTNMASLWGVPRGCCVYL